MKIWQDEKKFISKIFFQFKIVRFKKHKKCKNMSFSGSKKKQNVIFERKQFFKTWHVEKL